MSYRRTRRFLASASFTVLFQILSATGYCQNPAISFSETLSKVYNTPNLTRGYTIDVKQAFDVSALGVFDSGGDGLLTSHVVTIWNSSGNVVASVNLSAGTGDQLIGQFRYEAIAPVTLKPGDYTVGVYFPFITQQGLGDPMTTSISNLTTDPRFSIVSYEYANSGYCDPVGQCADHENFCGNFIIKSVPEPSTLGLLGAGGAAFVVRHHFRRRV